MRYAPGFGIRAWIASIAATTSSCSVITSASMFSFNCSSVVAPMIVDAVNPREYTNANAICVGVNSLALASSAYSLTAAGTDDRR